MGRDRLIRDPTTANLNNQGCSVDMQCSSLELFFSREALYTSC